MAYTVDPINVMFKVGRIKARKIKESRPLNNDRNIELTIPISLQNLNMSYNPMIGMKKSSKVNKVIKNVLEF
jgi:hypothetical protein